MNNDIEYLKVEIKRQQELIRRTYTTRQDRASAECYMRKKDLKRTKERLKALIKKCRRIAWLDSVNQPSRIHVTIDDGSTTLCGHKPKDEVNWKMSHFISNSIKKDSTKDRYCEKCFELSGARKSILFFNDIKNPIS